MEDCIFCDIAAGRATASVVYRGDRVMAFLDINPVNAGHIIVIPNQHFVLLNEIPEDLAAEVFTVASRLAAALRSSGLPCDGVGLSLADGQAAGQEVPHTHLHVVPRVAGDGFTIDAAAWSRPQPTRENLDANAAAIRAMLVEEVESGSAEVTGDS
jgi:histidine triad (HIT) family protein